MARSRNIKPAFFSNDILADCDPLGRLLFIGLWTIADFKGDIEWRPKRIKAQILPYDDCDIEKLAINLDKSGFVRFYSVQGDTYLNIINFNKHQNPHKNEKEKGSEIPALTISGAQVVDSKGIAINLDKSGLNREYSDSDPADSLNLIPDSCSLIPSNQNQVMVDKSPDRSKKFKTPELVDVQNYFFERTNDRDLSGREGVNFHSFYESKGWLVGKSKMKDWKASVRGWISRMNTNKFNGVLSQKTADSIKNISDMELS